LWDPTDDLQANFSKFNLDGSSAGTAFFGDTAYFSNTIGYPSWITKVGSEIWVSGGFPDRYELEGAIGTAVDYGEPKYIYNNILYENGLAELPGGNAVVKNNIIVGYNSNRATAFYETSGNPPTDYNLFYNIITPASLGAHDINGKDPLLVNPLASTFAVNNFALTSNSPALNAALTISDVVKDIKGVSRPLGSAYDIGAFEGSSSTTTSSPTPTSPQNSSTNTPTPTPASISIPHPSWWSNIPPNLANFLDQLYTLVYYFHRISNFSYLLEGVFPTPAP
jgi:hypothetical protein